MKCTTCGLKVYRKTLCRKCYKIYRLNRFHCTYGKCIKPVFAATLCQYHYRKCQTPCILCDRHIYCRSLCRKHYREIRISGKEFPKEPTCTKCDKTIYLQSLCLTHFKEKYQTSCLMVGCGGKSYKRGLCCKHYFRERRK